MEQKSKITKKNIWLSIGMVCIAFVAIISLTYAWFARNEKIATLLKIIPPDNITILGPNAQELERLDLSYTSEDITEEEIEGVTTKKVILKRIICVQSTAKKHRLEIVHTTNMKDLTFELHHVTDEGDKTVTDGIKSGNPMTVFYDPNPISGDYVNVERNQDSHKYANNTQHQQNYGTYDQVQIHAEPVYWLMDEAYSISETQQPVDNLYNTYYVLIISWTEDTKETDVFYILAQTEEEE